MSGAPVNLNRVRKAKAHAAKRARGAANAVKFGRSKAQTALEESEARAARHQLDLHRRDSD